MKFEKKDAKKNRLLTIHLSDGSRKIKATEYRHVPSLKKDILPGTKVHLVGKITYSNQTLFLMPENVKVIGGIVPEIGTIEYLIQLIEQDLYELLIQNFKIGI